MNNAFVKSIRDQGRADAQKWLLDPSAKPLPFLRLDYQDKFMDEIEAGRQQNPDPIVTAQVILEILSMYSAGIDEVIGEYIFLSQATRREVLQ